MKDPFLDDEVTQPTELRVFLSGIKASNSLGFGWSK
jgi:hypothetical protein